MAVGGLAAGGQLDMGVLVDSIAKLSITVGALADGQKAVAKAQKAVAGRVESLADGQKAVAEAQKAVAGRVESLLSSKLRAQRWEDHGDATELVRPPVLTIDCLKGMLARLGKFGDGDELYFFPDDHVELDARNRVRLTEASMPDWKAGDGLRAFLPSVWIYPRASMGTPTKVPTSLLDADVTTTTGTGRSNTLANIVKGKDQKCVVCGRTDSLDAAHILPFALKNWPDDNAFLNHVLGAAGITKEGLNTIPNVITLCKLHHSAFDKFAFTIDETSGGYIVAEGASREIHVLTGHALSMEHRHASEQPTPLIWRAYNSLFFGDHGAEFTCWKASKGVSKAGSAAGCGSGAGAGRSQNRSGSKK